MLRDRCSCAMPRLGGCLLIGALLCMLHSLPRPVLIRFVSGSILGNMLYFWLFDAMAPSLRRFLVMLPRPVKRFIAKLGFIEFLPLFAAIVTIVLLHCLGVIASAEMDQATIVLCIAGFVALVLGIWFQFQSLLVPIAYFFPYLTLWGPDIHAEPVLVDEESGKPLVALTIDDVPSTFEKFGPSDIASCLELLDKHGARATLFLMSRELGKHPSSVSRELARAVAKGYELGNHDVLDVKTIRRPHKEFQAVLRECDDAITDIMRQAGTLTNWHSWREFDSKGFKDFPIAEAVENILSALPPLPRVCILGAANLDDPFSKVLVEVLARDLAACMSNRIVVLTEGMRGVQELFAKAFGSSSPLVHLLPAGHASGFSVGKDVVAGNSHKERTDIFGRVGQVYISVGGGPEEAKKAKAAFERGAILIPLACSGGASSGMFGFPGGAFSEPGFATREQWACLQQKVSPESAARAVVEILTNLLASVELKVRAGTVVDSQVDVDRDADPLLARSPSASQGSGTHIYRDPLSVASLGESIKWFRPGGGFFTKALVQIAAAHGYSTVLGNCFPMDVHMPASHNAWYVRRRVRPGCIIILHDRPKLLATLHALLPYVCRQYKVVSLSGLFEAAAKAKVKAEQCSTKVSSPSQSRC